MAISLQFAASIDRFHGLLTTMFPHEGLTAIGGPGKLLHGSFLRKLEEVMEDLRDVAPAEAGVTGGGGEGILDEHRRWFQRLLGLGHRGDPVVLGECVRVLFLLTAMLWDRCVEQEGGTNLRPMNCIAPLKPMFAYCGFEGMADWPVADVLAELSKRRDEAMQWNDVQNPKQDVKTRRRWLGWIDRGLGMGIVALAVLPGCDRRAGNEVKRELWAPDGSRRLVVFCRTVDATTGFNTQVSMLGPGELLPDDGGNAFIADDGDVRVSWKADGGILIDYPGDLRVFKQEAVVGGVAVEYRKRP